jgi:hypothetical protein
MRLAVELMLLQKPLRIPLWLGYGDTILDRVAKAHPLRTG